VNNRENAEDITSKTFILLYQKIDLFEWKGISLKNWLFQTSRNFAYDKYREVTTENFDEEFHSENEYEISFVDEIMDKDLLEKVRKEIELLSPIEQEVINLRIWEGMQFNEIAEIQNASEVTTKQRFYRSIEKIKKNLEKKNIRPLIALPLIFTAISQVGDSTAYAAPMSLTSVGISALVTKTTMSTTLTSIKAFLASKAGAAAIIATILAGSAGTAGVYYANNKNKKTTDTTPVAQTTSTPTPTNPPSPTPTEISVANRYKFSERFYSKSANGSTVSADYAFSFESQPGMSVTKTGCSSNFANTCGSYSLVLEKDKQTAAFQISYTGDSTSIAEKTAPKGSVCFALTNLNSTIANFRSNNESIFATAPSSNCVNGKLTSNVIVRGFDAMEKSGFLVTLTGINETWVQDMLKSIQLDSSVQQELSTYTNTFGGYEISYPKSWVVYGPDPKSIDGGGVGTCMVNPPSHNAITSGSAWMSAVELSKTKPTSCNWFGGELLPQNTSEFSILAYSKPTLNINKLFSNPIKTSVNGIEAYKYDFIKDPVLPNIKATRIYFNNNNKGYVIFLKQIDAKGNYDPIYDQIISSLKFQPTTIKSYYYEALDLSFQYPSDWRVEIPVVTDTTSPRFPCDDPNNMSEYLKNDSLCKQTNMPSQGLEIDGPNAGISFWNRDGIGGLCPDTEPECQIVKSVRLEGRSVGLMKRISQTGTPYYTTFIGTDITPGPKSVWKTYNVSITASEESLAILGQITESIKAGK
jgi:RNA polymerase sigma-70 factor (ECF subfamily)